MLDIKTIRDDPAAFDAARARRGLEPAAASLLALDDARRAAIAALQVSQERRNAASKEVGAAMRAKDAARADALKSEIATLKEASPALESAEREASAALDAALLQLPNSPQDDVPDGRDEADNVVVRTWGDELRATRTIETPREHFDIGDALGLMDFAAAAKLSGARFVVLRGALARLERALTQFMLDLHVDHHGYEEIDPPLLVNDATMRGTAQLPKFYEDQFFAMRDSERTKLLTGALAQATPADLARLRDEPAALGEVVAAILERADTHEDLWLIPTAEVPLTNLVRESIVDEAALPLRYTAGTLCFRAEAGAAGRDTRGMIRQHQFAKVEMVSITTPEAAAAEHERMTACAEEVLKRLELPYRVMLLCAGDMGFASRKTYDLEVWLPGQGRYREISSCSVCGDFQARRMNARYRPKESKGPRFVATLNGSGVAVGRALVAVLENYQQPDGSVVVPMALRPYMRGLERIAPKA